MENYSVYEDMANRTGGDIYIGVVGPVRTGKSTFIKRFMQNLVIPNAEESQRSVMTDELPQSANGKTVMTTEPKFVPSKAANITVAKGAQASVRLVDCVGYAVDGAVGFEEDGKPRRISTPWQEEPMPFEKAAELGTEKVIKEHSTIGVLVTTDGSVTDIERKAYVPAEERTVAQLKSLQKPFVIVLNCKDAQKSEKLRAALEEKYAAPVVAVNVEKMEESEIMQILQKVLLEFPVTRIDVKLPLWLQTLPENNFAITALLSAVKARAPQIKKMRDLSAMEEMFEENAPFVNPHELQMDLGNGSATIEISPMPDLYYKVLSAQCGENLQDDVTLMRYVCELSAKKARCEKVESALEEAERTGYGIVEPTENDYTLAKPQLVKRSAGYGAQFRAKATGYHIVKVEVTGEVSPIIGTKQQGEEFIGETVTAYENDDGSVWETNIFGKSLKTLVKDELSGKGNAMPPELRRKLRRVTTRIVNEGKSNLFCFLF